uniref:Uncharacterized protein n=1 Tax=Panagrolaimus sp. ES5 TaxID=591445 RepID=A0AC34FBS9_9BILA
MEETTSSKIVENVGVISNVNESNENEANLLSALGEEQIGKQSSTALVNPPVFKKIQRITQEQREKLEDVFRWSRYLDAALKEEKLVVN